MNRDPRQTQAGADLTDSASLGRLDIAVVYIYPVGEPRYDEAARRFVSTYREFPPLADHTLHVIFNGEAPADGHRDVFAGVPCRFHEHDDAGWDIGAFQMASREIKCNMIVCLGGFTSFRRPGWLRRMADAFLRHGPGLYGASASYQITPHIRTTGFWCDPALIRAYPAEVRTYQDRYDFEHGEHSITRVAERHGLDCSLVTWDQVCPQAEWRKPANIFWRGDQSNSLVRDRMFDVYDRAGVMRPFYSALADGWGLVPGARALGKTKTQWLAGTAPEAIGEERADAQEDAWVLLAHEALKVSRASAPNDAAAIRIEEQFVDALSSESFAWMLPTILNQIRLRPEGLDSPVMIKSAIRLALGLNGVSGEPFPEMLSEYPWVLRRGMRLPLPRRLLLRLLQPFTDRQHESDARNAVSIALLSDELSWLRRRVEELEESRAQLHG